MDAPDPHGPAGRPQRRQLGRGVAELGLRRRLVARGAQPRLEGERGRRQGRPEGAAGAGAADGSPGAGRRRAARAERLQARAHLRAAPWRGGCGSSTTPPPSVSGGAIARTTSRSPGAREQRLLQPRLPQAAAQRREAGRRVARAVVDVHPRRRLVQVERGVEPPRRREGARRGRRPRRRGRPRRGRSRPG